jgi:hypothetical protein
MWEDLQHHYCFEGLVLHCEGAENRLSDCASRCKDKTKVEARLRKELNSLGMQEVKLRRTTVEWSVGDVNVDITPQLLEN